MSEQDITYEAQYESRCPACDEMIVEGDEITRDIDGEWIHLTCKED